MRQTLPGEEWVLSFGVGRIQLLCASFRSRLVSLKLALASVFCLDGLLMLVSTRAHIPYGMSL